MIHGENVDNNSVVYYHAGSTALALITMLPQIRYKYTKRSTKTPTDGI